MLNNNHNIFIVVAVKCFICSAFMIGIQLLLTYKIKYNILNKYLIQFVPHILTCKTKVLLLSSRVTPQLNTYCHNRYKIFGEFLCCSNLWIFYPLICKASNIYKLEENYSQMIFHFCWACMERISSFCHHKRNNSIKNI